MILTLISIGHILKGLVPGATSLWFIKVQLCSYGGNNVLSLYFRNVMCCQEACHPLAQAGLQNFWGQVGFIGNTFKITMFSKIVLQFLYHQKSLIHRQEIVQWRAGSIWWCHVLLLCCAMFRKDKLYILHRACACQLSSCEMSYSKCRVLPGDESFVFEFNLEDLVKEKLHPRLCFSR